MDSFTGTPRFELVRKLGAGAMGDVYEVIDRLNDNRHIALKLIRDRNPDAIRRLQREFRALSDLHHNNLVTLYELIIDDQICAIALELVSGVDFLQYVRPASVDLALDETLRVEKREIRSRLFLDDARQRSAVAQLAHGVAFLHAKGRLHRDLKPSNVMVTEEGRVVILDFGLASDFNVDRSLSEATGQFIVGTAAYMAPEQAAGSIVGPKADWYAFGVMLFQSITGHLPFEGRALDVLIDKQKNAAPKLRERGEIVSPELERLCDGLLLKDPALRPSTEEILRAVGSSTPYVDAQKEVSLIGREKEMDVLQHAFEQVRRRSLQVVRVRGVSGIGKSALTRQFADWADAEGALVLRGRCYERESVPFKALSSVVDTLVDTLGKMDPHRIDAFLPRDVDALVYMFPSFGRLLQVDLPKTSRVDDRTKMRRRGVTAMRELIGRIADRQPLVAIVDDAQWADSDSANLLVEILRAPDALSVLVLIASRPESNLLENAQIPTVDLALAPLSLDESRRLAVIFGAKDDALEIAAESQGNAFLLHQLAAFRTKHAMRLDDVIVARIEALSPPERRLLLAIAVAGAPIATKAALAAAKVGDRSFEVIQSLRVSYLLRSINDESRLDTWHDRIRQAAIDHLTSDGLATLHSELADALTLHEPDQVDAIAWHLGRSSQSDRAIDAMQAAALRSIDRSAFGRAEELLRRTIDLLPKGDRRRREMMVSLGDALAGLGRGSEAAACYEDVRSTPSDAELNTCDNHDLGRRAAEQLLRSGRVLEGTILLRDVARETGIRLPLTHWGARLALVVLRLRIFIRSRYLKRHKLVDGHARRLGQVDVCWSAAVGLSMIDPMRGAVFQSRHLLLALKLGEPFRLARAFAAEAAFVATEGISSAARAREILAEARQWADESGDRSLLGLIEFCDGLTKFLAGRWNEAARRTAIAETIFAEKGQAVSWEAANARLFSVWAYYYLGDLQRLSKRIPELVKEAEARGDRYTVVSLSSGLANVALLAANRPSEAREALSSAMKMWPTQPFYFQHYWAMLSESMIDLYERSPRRGYEVILSSWKHLQSSMLLRIQNVRVEARFLRARLALACECDRDAQIQSRHLKRERVGWATGFSLVIEACVDRRRSEVLLRNALEIFESEGMQLFAAATKLRLGQTIDGERGKAESVAAFTAIASLGVVDPEAFAETLIPRVTNDVRRARRRS